MTTKPKLDSKLPDSNGLAHIAVDLWDQLGEEFVAVVRFRVVERTQPDPGTELEPSVKVRVINVEVPDADFAAQRRTVEQALVLLYQARTSAGTLYEVKP